MTIRRRILVATLTIAGGVCCFQPVMRSRMKARLSEILGGRVEIGSSKISFLDSTIAFRDIAIHPVGSIQASKIGHAALKFSWNSLLFRNLKIERLLASDVHWEIADPSRDLIPYAGESEAPSVQASPDPNTTLASSVDSIIQPMKLKIVEEASKQSRVQVDVASRIKSVSERVLKAMPSDGTFNILRQTSIAEEAKKELATIKQLMAEDRLARKESDKTVILMTSSAQKNLVTNLGSFKELDSIKAQSDSIQLAKLAVAKEWNRNRSIVHTALTCLTALQNPIAKQNALMEQEKQDSRISNSDILTHLPIGFTRCVAGKVNGEVQFPNVSVDSNDYTSGFILQFWNLSSRNFPERENPAIALKVNRDRVKDEAPWLVCTAQMVDLPQSEATQIQVALERKQNGQSKSLITIQHANQGWAATMSLPIQNCFEYSTTESLVDKNILSSEKAIVIARLMGRTIADGSQQGDLVIEVENASINALEAILKPGYALDSEKKRAQASIRGTELLNGELLNINSRWEQLGDEHSRAHESWAASLFSVNEQLQRLETVFKRTTRNSSGISR